MARQHHSREVYQFLGHPDHPGCPEYPLQSCKADACPECAPRADAAHGEFAPNEAYHALLPYPSSTCAPASPAAMTYGPSRAPGPNAPSAASERGSAVPVSADGRRDSSTASLPGFRRPEPGAFKLFEYAGPGDRAPSPRAGTRRGGPEKSSPPSGGKKSPPPNPMPPSAPDERSGRPKMLFRVVNGKAQPLS